MQSIFQFRARQWTRHPGLGVRVFAFGDGTLGLLALGGLSVGLVAMGGGAVGFIAIGGGAVGRYVLAQRGWGKYVLAINRQDDAAVEFFYRWVPGIRSAVTHPVPVILLSQPSAAGKTM